LSEIFRPQTHLPYWFVYPRIGSILDQIFRPIQRFSKAPEERADNRFWHSSFDWLRHENGIRNHLAERRNGNSIRNPKNGKWPLFSGVSERLEEGPRVLYL
jgi:hypothetical protein